MTPPGGEFGREAGLPEVGLQVGHFRLREVLGRGGFGTVFLADDLDIPERRVAIKLVRSDGIAPGLESVRREASALASLQHPNILVVHEIGTSPQGVYLVTEYMPGGSLANVLARGPLSPDRALPLARAAADALSAAHDRGVLHRDIKPANLLLGTGGRLKVGDFGLALLRVTSEKGEPGERAGIDTQGTTVTGADLSPPRVAGTPCYISPETLQGSPPGPHADQFAFGVTLHELLTGRRPFDGPGWALAAASGEARIDASLPADLARIVRRCVAREPGARYAGMHAVTADLDDAIRRRGPERKRLLRVVASGAIILGLLAGGWAWTRWRSVRQAQSLNETGRRALERGDLEAARRAFLSAHGADPAYLPACANLGSLAAMEENPKWAVTILEECRATFPDSAAILYNLGAALRLTGDAARAEGSLREALRRSPGSDLRPFILNELAMVLLAADRAPEVLPLLEVAESSGDTIEGAILSKTRGLALLETGKPVDAVEALRRGLGGPLPEPQRAIALAALGRALESTGDTRGAVEAFSQVLLQGADRDSERAAREGLARLQARPKVGP